MEVVEQCGCSFNSQSQVSLKKYSQRGKIEFRRSSGSIYLVEMSVSDFVYEMIFSGGIKKGGTWGGPTCAAAVPYDAHLLETGIWCVGSVVLYFVLDIRKFVKDIANESNLYFKAKRSNSVQNVLDVIFMFFHFCFFFQVVLYKINLKSLINLLQPCYLSLLLGGLSISCKGSTGVLITIANMPLAIGAATALAWPATEGLDQPFEEISFFIHHYLLLLTPLYLVCRNNFLVAKLYRIKCLFFANWIIMVVHWYGFSVRTRNTLMNNDILSQN